jgi:hypothetical protein
MAFDIYTAPDPEQFLKNLQYDPKRQSHFALEFKEWSAIFREELELENRKTERASGDQSAILPPSGFTREKKGYPLLSRLSDTYAYALVKNDELQEFSDECSRLMANKVSDVDAVAGLQQLLTAAQKAASEANGLAFVGD